MNAADGHLSDEQIQRYGTSSSSAADRLAVSDHLADCTPCRERLSAASKTGSPKVLGGVREPSAEPFHLSYELMRDHVKGKLDAVDRELVESHVADCGSCRRELEDLTAFAQSLDQEESFRTLEKAEPGFDWSQRRQS